MYGINEIYDELLLEAKSPEEIKKILEYQFVQGKGVPQEILDAIFNIDPTKKKSYTKWVLIHWESDADAIKKALGNGRLAKLFQYAQERANTGFSLTSTDSFEDAIGMLPDEDPIFAKEGNGPENDFEVVFESAEWKIAVPHTYEADKKLGQGCKWCTAGAFGDNDGYWKRYSAYGPLWVNFDLRESEICPVDNKEYPYTRYQFLFEWDNFHGELMDCHDHRIKFEDIDIPQDVIEFYREQDERYADVIENSDEDEDPEERYERYVEERYEHGHTIKDYNDSYLMLLPEEDDNYTWQGDVYDYYVYDDSYDSSDPLSWDRFNPDDFIVDLCGNLPIVALKSRDDELCMYRVAQSRFSSHWVEIPYVKDFKHEGSLIYYITENGVEIRLDSDQDWCEYISFNDLNMEVNNVYINKTGCDTENGIWVEAFSDDEPYHSLSYLQFSDGVTYKIFKLDIPKNGEYFEVEQDEKGFYIEGQILGKKYIKDKYAESTDDSMDIESKCNGDDSLYIVSIGGRKNFYDTKTKQLLLKNGVGDIVDKGGASLLFDFDDEGAGRIFVVYDYIKRQQLTKPLKDYLQSFKNGYCYARDAEDDSLHIFSTNNGLKEIANLGNVNLTDSFACYPAILFTKTDGYLEFFDLNNGNIFGPDNVKKYGNISKMVNSPIVMLQDTNGETFIYNMWLQKIILSNCSVARPNFIANGCFTMKMANGKFVIASPTKGAITEEVDDATINYNKIRITNNNRLLWAYFEGEELNYWPSKEGVDANIASHTSPFDDNWNLRVGNATITLIPGRREYTVYPDTEESKSMAEKYLFPQQAQISENFMRMYKRIINTEK